MAVHNLCRQQLPHEEMTTYGLSSKWDDFYLAVPAAITASLTRKQEARRPGQPDRALLAKVA